LGHCYIQCEIEANPVRICSLKTCTGQL